MLDRVSNTLLDRIQVKEQVMVKVKEQVIRGVQGGKKEFTLPTVEQVAEYCQERKNGVDPNKWHSWYTANGWKVGKNPMKDWKAAVRTWEDNSKPTSTKLLKVEPVLKINPIERAKVADLIRETVKAMEHRKK